MRRFHGLIQRTVVRTAQHWGAAQPALLDDLVQETYAKLCTDGCRLLREFECSHPDAVFGFLKVLTANVVHDHFRAQHAAKRGERVQAALPEGAEPAAGESHAGHPRAIEREILLHELEAMLAGGAPAAATANAAEERDALIFRLYYRDGLTAAAIAAQPQLGLSAKGVESAILRMTRALRERVRAPGGMNRTTAGRA